MALPLIVDKIDSVAEPFRGEYEEKDGKFRLKVEGLEDTGGLKSALEKERTDNKALKDSMRQWGALGKAPAEIQEMLETERRKADEALVKAGKVDELLSKKVGEVKQDYEGKLTDAEKKRESALGIARKAIVNTHVSGALVKAKATVEGLDLLAERLGSRVKIEFGDNGESVISILAADGTPMIGSGQGGRATFDDLVKEACKNYPSLFEGTGAGGGGKPPKDGGGPAGKTIKRSEFDALQPLEKHAKIKDGFKVVD